MGNDDVEDHEMDGGSTEEITRDRARTRLVTHNFYALK